MILTIDIGGTTIKYSLVKKNKIIDKVKSIVTEKDSYDVFIKNLIKIYDSYEFLEGIAIACPGAIDDNGKSIGISAIPCIYDQNIKEDLEKYTGKKVAIENDANCSLISELWNKEINSAASIVIGTGIGGSFIENGSLIKGYKKSAGEIGLFSTINTEGQFQMQSLSIIQATTKYNDISNEAINGIELFERYRNREELAINIVDEFFYKLVSLIMNIEFFINPEYIVISGGVIQENNFLELLEKYYNDVINKNEGMYLSRSKIVLSEYNSSSNLIGASYIWHKG